MQKRPIGVWVLLMGACMTVGFAPFNLWPVAVLSLAGLWWLVKHAESKKQVAGAALVWGIGHGVTGLYWLPWAFFKDFEGSWIAALGGGIPVVLGLAVYTSLTYMLAGLAGWSVGRRVGWGWGAVVWVLAIVLIEFVKGLHPMGFPWLPVGAIFANMELLSLTAALGGVWLLSACGLTMAVLLGSGNKRALLGIPVILMMMVVWGYGWLLQHVLLEKNDANQAYIRVVQPNITSIGKWDPKERFAILKETVDVAMAREDASSTIPRTVILPETAVAFYLDEEEDVKRALAQRVAMFMPADGGLVTGTIRREMDSKTGQMRYFNSLDVMDMQGVMRGKYDKRFLVPFGEYIPGRSWLEALPLPLPLRTLSQSRIDFSHGGRSPLLDTPAGYAVGLICYEGIFPLQVGMAAHEARYMINVSNDGWFTGTIALYQHAALTRLRAIETGLPMVRVTHTGLTIVYDGLGRERLRLPINIATHADVKLPPPLPNTPFLTFLGAF